MFHPRLPSLFFVLAAVWLAGCNAQTVEVTRIVTEEVEVTRVVTTAQVVTEEVEVTRLVEMAAEPIPTGELIIVLATEPNAIYMPNAAERNAQNVAGQIYDGLVWVDDAGRVVPALATGWEMSADNLTYTFTLQTDVVFHDGTPFTAEDVVATWQAGQDEANAYAYLYEAASAVQAVDAYTVRIVTQEPDVLFLRDLHRWGIISAEQFAADGRDGLEEQPNGTGAFRFVEWQTDGRITLEANPTYWEPGLPHLARLVFVPMPDGEARAAAVQSGEVHIVPRLNATQAQSLLGAPTVRVVRYPVDRVYYIAFNNLTTGVGLPTEDPLVRQAMNHAVNREAIVQRLFSGYARLSAGFVTPSNLGFDETIAPYTYDPDKARALLAEAGYPDGFAIGMACPSGAYTNFEEVCKAVANDLAAVGITLEGEGLELIESSTFWELEADKALPPLFGDSWSDTSGEAIIRLKGALMGEESSFAAWADPQITELLEAISGEFDQEKRALLYRELSHYLFDNPPFIYLYEPNAFEAVNVAVQNYNPRAGEDYYLKTTFLAEE